VGSIPSLGSGSTHFMRSSSHWILRRASLGAVAKKHKILGPRQLLAQYLDLNFSRIRDTLGLKMTGDYLFKKRCCYLEVGEIFTAPAGANCRVLLCHWALWEANIMKLPQPTAGWRTFAGRFCRGKPSVKKALSIDLSRHFRLPLRNNWLRNALPWMSLSRQLPGMRCGNTLMR